MVPLVDAPNKVSSLTYLTRPNLTYRRYPRLRTYNVYICLYALYKIEPSNLRAQHSKDNMWMWCLYQTINIKFSNARDSGVSKNHQVPARSHAWSIMLPWRNCNLSIAYFQTCQHIPTYPNTCWWSSIASNSRPYPTWWISLAISPRQAPPVLLMRLASQTPDGYWDDLQTDQISMLFFGASAPFPWPFLWQSSDWPNFWVFLSWIPTKFWVSLHSPNCYTDGRVLAP